MTRSVSSSRTKAGWLALAMGVSLLAATPALAQKMPGKGPGPIAVGVVSLTPTALPMTADLSGRVAASATAQVRPRVGGMITAVNFTEGAMVQKGDVLFEIDAANYEADVAIAAANLQSAQAQVSTADSKVTRYKTLAGKSGISQAELDAAEVALAQALASVQSAEAQLRIAKLSLERASVTAPISGIAGISTFEVGALVTANQGDALTTIRQLDPVNIEMTESSSNLLRMRQGSADGRFEGATGADATVKVTLDGGLEYAHQGSVSVADVVVSETTGSFSIRASMPNPDRILMPGMFVRAQVTIGQQTNAYLVPQRAITFNDNGQATAYFVSASGTAEQRVVTTAREIDNDWVVTAGIEAGDQLIVDGLQKISDGSAIAPLAVVIEDNGVVYQPAPRSVAAVQAETK